MLEDIPVYVHKVPDIPEVLMHPLINHSYDSFY